MSKLDELIKELCPNGVEYKKTKDIVQEKFWIMPETPNFIEEGIPYITSKNIKNGFIDFKDVKYVSVDDYNRISNNRKIKKDDMLITMIGTIGEVAIVENEIDFYGQNLYLLRMNNEIILNKYYYYYITSNKIKRTLVEKRNTSSQGYIKAGSIENLLIPIPPLEVQDEIVRILDNFTALTAELTAELTARKKQYSWYRDYLLKFENKVKMVKIGNVSELKSGGTPKTENLEYWENGIIPWMSSGEVNKGNIYKTEKKITKEGYKNSNTKMLPKNTVVIALAGQGKTRGTVAITRIELCTNQSLCGIIPNEKLNSDYLYHYLKTQYENLRQLSSGDGTRGGLNLKMIDNYLIPLPPLEEQQRIVDILDRFDKLCNDISEGLPAEIEIRQKQYEYYREKLLSFKKL